MAEQGGYRKPNNPAAVSGPGQFSQRTDGKPGTTPKQAKRYIGGGEYGTNKAFNAEVVAAAPMEAALTAADASTLQLSSNLPTPIPLTADTQRPDEPITHGVDSGDGAGSDILQYKQQQDTSYIAEKQRAAILLNLLSPIADNPDASDTTRQMVKRLRGMI